MIPDQAIQAAADGIHDAAFGQELPEAPIDLARAALQAALPAIFSHFVDVLNSAAFKVDSTHHYSQNQCLCGEPVSARKRTQTEHITGALITEFAEAYKEIHQ